MTSTKQINGLEPTTLGYSSYALESYRHLGREPAKGDHVLTLDLLLPLFPRFDEEQIRARQPWAKGEVLGMAQAQQNVLYVAHRFAGRVAVGVYYLDECAPLPAPRPADAPAS